MRTESNMNQIRLNMNKGKTTIGFNEESNMSKRVKREANEMKMMSRAYLKQIKREAILKGNISEMKRINKIAKFNGIAF